MRRYLTGVLVGTCGCALGAQAFCWVVGVPPPAPQPDVEARFLRDTVYGLYEDRERLIRENRRLGLERDAALARERTAVYPPGGVPTLPDPDPADLIPAPAVPVPVPGK